MTSEQNLTAEPEERDRHGEMFDVDLGVRFGINAIHIARTTITPGDYADSNGLSWSISGFPQRNPQYPMMLMGDLAARTDGWFLGVSVMMSMAVAESIDLNPDDETSLNEWAYKFGVWASNPLYDVARLVGASLISSAFTCDIELPSLTPKMIFREVERLPEDDEVSSD